MPNEGMIAALRYEDAPAAIEWLCRAFGFERNLVVPDDAGGIAHAQLVFGQSMLMLGGHRDDEFGRLMRVPREAGVSTQSLYVIVSDVDGHCARARAAGAEIVMEPVDQDYGGRGYTCRDLEGHVWSFGSYDPWAK
jgi:uncharacterized glyoxalase superfamily protein PhnB